MRILLGLVGSLALVLTACAIGPERTTWSQFSSTFHNVDHPEYAQLSYKEGEKIGRRDGAACAEEIRPLVRADGIASFSRHYWSCMRTKGWRWDEYVWANGGWRWDTDAGLPILPDGTTRARVNETIHHPNHGHPDRTQSSLDGRTAPNPAYTVLMRDSETCGRDLAAAGVVIRPPISNDGARALYACLWAKGWRWDTDAPPGK